MVVHSLMDLTMWVYFCLIVPWNYGYADLVYNLGVVCFPFYFLLISVFHPTVVELDL